MYQLQKHASTEKWHKSSTVPETFYFSTWIVNERWVHAQWMVSTVWANGKRIVSAHWTEFCKPLWIVNGEWTQRTNGAQTRAQSEWWTICAPIWTHGEHTVNAQKKWEIITFQGLWLENQKFSNLHVQHIPVQWKLFVIHKVCKSS